MLAESPTKHFVPSGREAEMRVRLFLSVGMPTHPFSIGSIASAADMYSRILILFASAKGTEREMPSEL